MKTELRIASAARWAPAVAYVITVGLLGLLIFLRSEGEAPRAARLLPPNYQIVAGDLETPRISKAIGKYVVAEVKKGRTVTEKDLVDALPPPQTANTLAAVVNVPLKTRHALALNVGDAVQICVAGGAFGGQSQVLRLDCDAAYCAVWLRLDAAAAAPRAADPLSDAWLIKSGMSCNQARP